MQYRISVTVIGIFETDETDIEKVKKTIIDQAQTESEIEQVIINEVRPL